MKNLEIKKDGLLLDGEPFYLASGDIHYFRIFPGGWKRRLQLMKDFGLNTVQTYMPWNLHEPQPGQFDFSGMLDIEAFIRLCDEMGFKVILRCSPYLCGEWELGGMPSWLLKNDEIALRCCDERFMAAVESYTKEVCRRIVPLLHKNGGPIILLGLENEYGSFGNDLEYIQWLADLYRKNGIDVPLLTSNGAEGFKLIQGTLKDCWAGMDTHAANIAEESKQLTSYQPDKPVFVSEMWDGRAMLWKGGKFVPRDPKPIAQYYKNCLDINAYVSFYMFCGGTNFGFMNGANINRHPFLTGPTNVPKYYPMMTSYDVNAAVTENGVPTEKYFLLRDELDAYLGKEKRPHIAPEYKTQTPADTHLEKQGGLFDNLDAITTKCVKSGNTKSMEYLGQDYGFILYSTDLLYTGDYTYHLLVEGLHDRVQVFLDGKYLGTYMRDEENETIKFKVPAGGAHLDLLVENTGRINYGRFLLERKGITGTVAFDVEKPDGTFIYNIAMVNNWTIRCLPLKDISKVEYNGAPAHNTPSFYKGTFKAEAGVDTFIDMSAWKKGNVWINGFNIGRFWSVGSQQTLYLPGELLKEENTIEVLELYARDDVKTITFTNDHIFSDVDIEGWNASIKA